MASISASELIKRSLAMIGKFGEGETLQAYQGEQARITLNNMFEQWNLTGITVYNHITNSFNLVGGISAYTIGIGGDINIARPTQINNMYVRFNNIDIALREISYIEYANISLKSLQVNIPSVYYYETSLPLGIIHLLNLPNTVYTVYYVVPQVFTSVTALSDSISYPDGYGMAIETNLAVELSLFYPNSLRQEIIDKAKESKSTIMNLNAQKQMVYAHIDNAFTKSNGTYNIYSLTSVSR